MRIEFIEAKPSKTNKKIIILTILGIVFVVFFSILGINYAKLYKGRLIADKLYKNNIINTNKKESEKTNNLEDRDSVKKVLLPRYTENSKEKMNKIYNSEFKIAYLTFDDGPSRAVTPLILDLLKEENIKATFFVLGSNVKRNPDILKRIYLEGHYIANHGYSHNYEKIYENPEEVLKEYNKTEKQIKKAIDNEEYNSHLFRFPGGFEGGKYEKIKKKAGIILNQNNISYIDWNVLTGDAEGANTKEKIIKNIKKYVKDKGNIVILMHDSSSKILTYETLKDVINYLREEGYTFDNFYSIMQ